MSNDDESLDQTKARVHEAFSQTQAQTEEAAAKLVNLFQRGAKTFKKAADAAADAIRDDIQKRP